MSAVTAAELSITGWLQSSDSQQRTYPVLAGPWRGVVLSGEHHKVDAAVVKRIPEGGVDMAAVIV